MSRIVNPNNAGLVKCFRDALKRIENGEDYYICYAIRYTDHWQYVKNRATNIVMSRLERQGTLEGWLLYKGYYSWHDQDKPRVIRAVRKHRIAWLKSLIKEFHHD